jgi:hypothetical protein
VVDGESPPTGCANSPASSPPTAGCTKAARGQVYESFDVIREEVVDQTSRKGVRGGGRARGVTLEDLGLLRDLTSDSVKIATVIAKKGGNICVLSEAKP